jgi:hypothetical protein
VSSSESPARSGREFVEASFTDTGSGIAKDHAGKLFEPNFSTKSHGTGLGLAICRGIMDAYGGAILIESTEGEGTCVRVRFPVAAKPSGSRPSTPRASRRQGGRRRGGGRSPGRKPREGKPGEGKLREGKLRERKSGDRKPAERKPGERRSGGRKPGMRKSVSFIRKMQGPQRPR